MRFSSIFAAALTAVVSTATWIPPASPSNPLSPIPGYPFGGSCLSDAQAQFIAEQFRQILANPDRSKANTIAQVLMASNYVETSDSINILAGYPLGGPSFSTKQDFISGAVAAPALPGFTTLKVFHDCTNILWQWRVTGLGLNKYPVKGFNSLVVNPISGVIQSTNLEFNSVAWGTDIGWTCTPPPSGPH